MGKQKNTIPLNRYLPTSTSCSRHSFTCLMTSSIILRPPRLRMGAEFALASSSQKLLLCADFCGMTFKQLSLGLSPRTQTLSKCVCVSLCERVWLFLFFSLTTKVCRDISRRAQAFRYFACHKTCCFALLFLPLFLS